MPAFSIIYWGYVSYPPVTPFIARVAITLFGPTLFGARLFSSLAHALAVLLTGLMARELGGNRWAQVTAAVAVAIAPFVLLGGTLLTYSTFDYLWWVLIAYQMIRLLKSNDPRWWLGIGAVIGVGMMTKYAIGFWWRGMSSAWFSRGCVGIWQVPGCGAASPYRF